jgi:hypothetical protein
MYMQWCMQTPAHYRRKCGKRFPIFTQGTYVVARKRAALPGNSSSGGSGVQLLGGDFGGGSGLAGGVLALIFQESEDLAGLVGLALGLIELG